MRIFRNNKRMSRFGGSFCLVLILTVFPGSPALQGTGERILTNFELVERISCEAIDELLSNMPPVSENKLLLLEKSRSAGDIDFVFENSLLKKMRDAGFRVSNQKPAQTDSLVYAPDYKFSYQIIRMLLRYPSISRRYWLGAKEVERLAEIAVFVQLVDLRTGDIVWVGDTQRKFNDVFAHSMLGAVEDEQYEFTRPPRKELKWRRLIEPVIVTGIVTGLVYLFFSNQSDE